MSTKSICQISFTGSELLGRPTNNSITLQVIANTEIEAYVEYGTTTEYGDNTTLDSNKVTSHTQTLSGLLPGTTYHYKVKSIDAAGNESIQWGNERKRPS